MSFNPAIVSSDTLTGLSYYLYRVTTVTYALREIIPAVSAKIARVHKVQFSVDVGGTVFFLRWNGGTSYLLRTGAANGVIGGLDYSNNPMVADNANENLEWAVTGGSGYVNLEVWYDYIDE